MKKVYLFYLVMCVFMLSCSNSLTVNADPSTINSDPVANLLPHQKEYYRWGEDVVYAAIYHYGSRSGKSENFEGAMFPIIVGYISFEDHGDQKMLNFTSSNNINTGFIESLCERINKNKGWVDGYWWFSMDDPQFCGVVRSWLYAREIREVIRLPLGTAKDYDFAFKEQIEYSVDGPAKLLGMWGITKDNLIMTPKQ